MIATPTRTDAGRFAPPPPRVTTFDELFAIWSVATAEAKAAEADTAVDGVLALLRQEVTR